MCKNIIIGVIGGMGTYATIHLFQEYAFIFPAEKEWERPRIIIDNRCTMPSRVRAFLLHENRDQLIRELSESLLNLVHVGCTHIIMACNTSHLFLPDILEMYPELETKIVNIVNICIDQIVINGIKKTYILGSEGTIESQIYQNALREHGVECDVPESKEYSMIRSCIEAVKQNKYTNEIKQNFIQLLNRCDTCILGCTELPVLYERYKEEINCGRIYDPIQLGLKRIKREYDNAEDFNFRGI